MGSISLLHIGDIHFSFEEIHQTPSNPRNIGCYDWSELSEAEKSNLIQFLVRQIKKSLYDTIERENFGDIIFTGDLCRQGDRQGYQDCLDYIKLQFHNFSKRISQSQLKISAGNHDLCSNYDYDPDNLRRRFIPFCNILTENRFSEYAIDSVIYERIENENGKLLLININSCLEFGNITHLPQSRQDAIIALVDNPDSNANRNYLLNIPFINENILNQICEIIQDNFDCLPVIFTHHNFSHIGQYHHARENDQILNAGLICDKLESLHRPILIFHGHIHSCSL